MRLLASLALLPPVVVGNRAAGDEIRAGGREIDALSPLILSAVLAEPPIDIVAVASLPLSITFRLPTKFNELCVD